MLFYLNNNKAMLHVLVHKLHGYQLLHSSIANILLIIYILLNASHVFNNANHQLINEYKVIDIDTML